MMIILTGSIFTAVEENLCAAASGFSDATAPSLNSYQRTDYLNDLIFIDLWMNNWSGHYFWRR